MQPDEQAEITDALSHQHVGLSGVFEQSVSVLATGAICSQSCQLEAMSGTNKTPYGFA